MTSLYYSSLPPQDPERDLQLAVVGSRGDTIDCPETPPWPTSIIPDSCLNAKQEWFHSQATLENVRSIDVCQNRLNGHCLGILLHYHDLHTEVVGQWRFDQSIKNMPKQSNPVSIHFLSERVNGLPCVKSICVNSQQQEDNRWQTFGMRGSLVWWFCEDGGFISHNDVAKSVKD